MKWVGGWTLEDGDRVEVALEDGRKVRGHVHSLTMEWVEGHYVPTYRIVLDGSKVMVAAGERDVKRVHARPSRC